MIDSTIVRAHHCAVGVKKGTQQTKALGRSRRELHQAKGRPLGFVTIATVKLWLPFVHEA
jgi:hypothetical protein